MLSKRWCCDERERIEGLYREEKTGKEMGEPESAARAEENADQKVRVDALGGNTSIAEIPGLGAERHATPSSCVRCSTEKDITP